MNSLVLISFCFIAAYIIVFSLLTFGFLLKKKKETTLDLVPITVIIPFRNEEENLIDLIQSFISLNYNLNIVEFIFIDDHSTDNGYQLLSSQLKQTALLYKIIKQSEFKSGKKQAIETALNNAKNEFIVTIDADSTPTKNWLQQYSNAFQSGGQFIIGPVINKDSNHFLGQLHSIEALILSGVAMGSASLNKPIICSGANLGYTKSLFNELNPYQNNISIASGDDVFFLDKVVKANKKVMNLKTPEALVYTQVHSSYQALLSQAIRWSSKNNQLNQKSNFYLSILIFVTNILIIPNLFYGVMGRSESLFFLLSKFLIDILFFISISSIYKRVKLIFFTPFIYFFYPIHLLIIFVSSLFVSVQWKGRTIVKNEKQ